MAERSRSRANGRSHPAGTPRSSAGRGRRIRLGITVVVVFEIAFVTAPHAPAVARPATGPKLTVVAANLDNPRKLFVGPGGAIYVVEAGHADARHCLGPGPRAICVGPTGLIARLGADGKPHPALSGLVSFGYRSGEDAQGISDARLAGGRFVVLLGDTGINRIGANDLGPDGVLAGDILSTPPGRLAPRVIASLAAFEAANNPDHGAGPGARFGDPAIDSNPYAFVPYRAGYAVVDAAANDLLWVSSRGAIRVLAVFPTQTEPLTPALDRAIAAPATMRSIAVQAVPTCVAVGPNGALYVGELTGEPFEPGQATIWEVQPGKASRAYATGLSDVTDIAFDDGDLLVLELAANGLLAPRSEGELIRITPSGGRSVVASVGLVDPTGLAVSAGWIYISNDGTRAATGPLPHGEVVRLAASAAS